LLVWPFLGTVRMINSLPLWYMLVAYGFGFAMFAVPMTYGKMAAEHFCAIFAWGWAYCPDGTKTLEMFTHAAGCIYYAVFPIVLLGPARFANRVRLTGTTLPRAADIIPLVVGIAGTAVMWYWLYYTLQTFASLMSPGLWCMLGFIAISIFFLVSETKRALRGIGDPASVALTPRR